MQYFWQTNGLDRSSSQPLHVQIILKVRTAIADGHLRPGDLLLSEPELAHMLGVARATLRLALRRLANDGLIERRRGQGTRITNRAAAYCRPGPPAETAALLADVSHLRTQVALLCEQLQGLQAVLSENVTRAQQAGDRQWFTVARVRSGQANRRIQRAQRAADRTGEAPSAQ